MFAEHNTSDAFCMLYSPDFKLATIWKKHLNMIMFELCFSTFHATHSTFSPCLSNRYAVDRGILFRPDIIFHVPSARGDTYLLNLQRNKVSVRLGCGAAFLGGCRPKFWGKVLVPNSNILIPLGLLEHWRWHQYVLAKLRGPIIYCRGATSQQSGDVTTPLRKPRNHYKTCKS